MVANAGRINGKRGRDFTYVDDVVRANRTLLSSDAADGEVLNIGSTDNIDIQTLAAVVRDELAPELEMEYAERAEADAEHTRADVGKTRELLGYEPSVDIREGAGRFIDWYRKN